MPKSHYLIQFWDTAPYRLFHETRQHGRDDIRNVIGAKFDQYLAFFHVQPQPVAIDEYVGRLFERETRVAHALENMVRQ